mmetsp:Transcript_2857/g.5658  ORF Transcript_2857/g.5658 Transcript_2857/m.5658 type:complete len:263 (-) Transcript_2857:796-1584(-)
MTGAASRHCALWSSRSLQRRQPSRRLLRPFSRNSSAMIPQRWHCHAPAAPKAALHLQRAMESRRRRASPTRPCSGQQASSGSGTCQLMSVAMRLAIFATLSVDILGRRPCAAPACRLPKLETSEMASSEGARCAIPSRSARAGVPGQLCLAVRSWGGSTFRGGRSSGVRGRMSVNSRMPSRWCWWVSGPVKATEKNSMEIWALLLSLRYAWKTSACVCALSVPLRASTNFSRSPSAAMNSWIVAPCRERPDPWSRTSDSFAE